MDALILLGLAIAPGIAISFFIYYRDKYEREPRKILIVSFFLGMLAIVPAIFFESLGAGVEGPSTFQTLIYTFIVIGFTEELCKFIMLRLYAYRQQAFNEPFDGITYAVMVSMGFATLENIFYVYQYGMGNAFVRMFTAVPAHAVNGIVMGYYAGLAKFRANSASLLRRGLLFATLLHGAYDFCLMEQNIPMIAGGALVALYIGIRFSRKAIKLHQEISPFKKHYLPQ